MAAAVVAVAAAVESRVLKPSPVSSPFRFVSVMNSSDFDVGAFMAYTCVWWVVVR